MIGINTYIGNENERQSQFFAGKQAAIWTAIPGIIQKFDAVALTCEIQPAIQGKNRKEDGSIELVNLPLLLDCPVVFPHAGGCSLTFPIKTGDECLVVFSCRAIDLWWQSGGIQPPAEIRMHDLSDGFCIPGCYSQPNVIPSVSTDSVQLRSDDAESIIEINPNSHNILIKTPSDVSIECDNAEVKCDTFDVQASTIASIKAPQIALDGQITAGGSSGANAAFTGSVNVTNDVTASGISLKSHVHSGVQSGGSNTNPPVG
jgi:phage baseplate assembly protein V